MVAFTQPLGNLVRSAGKAILRIDGGRGFGRLLAC